MANNRIDAAPECTMNRTIVACVLVSFLIAYSLFFIQPVFLNSKHAMQFIPYVPTKDPIGCDLQLLYMESKSWFVDKHTPYVGSIGLNPYPPFTTVVYTPLCQLKFPIGYQVITFFNFFCYCVLILLIPILVCKIKNDFSLLFLLFFTGLFSYGFHFELERGQFNVIAFLLCMFAVYLYHYQRKWRIFSYLLLSASIQLKLFPAIFVFMFIEDWRAWKSNVKRVTGILVFNFAMLFILGYRVFLDFTESIRKHILNPDIAVTNLSIKSFVTLFLGEIPSQLHLSVWMRNMLPWALNLGLLALVVACIFLIGFKAYQQKTKGLNPYLLLACTAGALLIPSTSHDYKLTILGAPLAIVLYSISSYRKSRKQWPQMVLIFIASFAYSSTLFSFAYKPHFLKSNFPAVMVILFSVTVLALLKDTGHDSESISPKQYMPHRSVF